MKESYDPRDVIFQPLKFRNLTVKNRIFRSNMTGPFDNYDGSGAQPRINWEERFARGGVGAICSAHAPVAVRGQISPHIAMIDHDDKIPFWHALISRIHKYDCRYIIQLSHAGRQRDVLSLRNLTLPGLSSTSNRDALHGLPAKAMTTKEIGVVVDEFGRAAARAREAGADGVELHAANGYLFTQFLSASINDRTDEYGGSLSNRARFLMEVIHSIRAHVGSGFHLQVKLSAVEFNNILLPWTNPGQTLPEAIEVCKLIEKFGADAIVVSGGSFAPHPRNPAGDFPLTMARRTYSEMINSGNKTFRNYVMLRLWPFGQIFRAWWAFRRGPKSNIEGIFLEHARAIKRNVKIPVLVTGGFQTASVIAEAIRSGGCDAVTIARPLIANPDLVHMFKQGMDRAPRPCTYCNACLVEALGGPLGCYDGTRFDDNDAMLTAVLDIFRPQQFEPQESGDGAATL